MSFTRPMPFSKLVASTCAAVMARSASSTAESKPKDLSITYTIYLMSTTRGVERALGSLEVSSKYRNVIVDSLGNAGYGYFEPSFSDLLHHHHNQHFLSKLHNTTTQHVATRVEHVQHLEYHCCSFLRSVSTYYVHL